MFVKEQVDYIFEQFYGNAEINIGDNFGGRLEPNIINSAVNIRVN